MDFSALAKLALATMILGFSPGPAVFATLGRSLSLGLVPTAVFIAGIVTGDFIFALLAMGGVAALVAKITGLFLVLKVLGGGYLIYLGAQSLRAVKGVVIAEKAPEKSWRIFLSGFALTAGNPKDLLFFISFVPVFIDLAKASVGDMLTASAVITVTFVFTLSVYALFAASIRHLFLEGRVIQWLNRCAGMMMIGVGIFLLAGIEF